MSTNDTRYRVLVMLQRSDREKYWTFYCPQCQQRVKEVNGDMKSITDTFSVEGAGQPIRCGKGWCRIYWYFKLSG